MENLFVLGVAGPYCSGKTTVASYLAKLLGWDCIEVDALGHQALRICQDQVVGRFGTGILDANAAIDRRVLGGLVFGQLQRRLDLEAIVHPVIRQMVADRLAAALAVATPAGIIINAALLYYMGLDAWCDRVIWVAAPWHDKLRRAGRRDRLSPNLAAERLRAQVGLLPKAAARAADIIIVQNQASRRVIRRLAAIMGSGRWSKNG